MKVWFRISWLNYREGATTIDLTMGEPGGGYRLGVTGRLELEGHQPVDLQPGQLVCVEVEPAKPAGEPKMVDGDTVAVMDSARPADPFEDPVSRAHRDWCLAFGRAFGLSSGLRAPLVPTGVAACLAGWLEHLAHPTHEGGEAMCASRLRDRARALRSLG